MSYAVYVFADANRVQQKIRSDEVTWTGTWSSTGTYAASLYDSLIYGNDRYVAIIDNVGVNPTAKLPNKQPNPFAYLSIYQAGDEPPFSPPTASVDIQYQALQTAWHGTQVANEAYAIAVQGTIVANQASADAGTALTTAWAGTTTADGAYAVAISIQPSVYQAQLSAWAGTDAANQALAISQQSLDSVTGLADYVIPLAIAGTNAAASAASYADLAFGMAATGTAAASAGIDLANEALVLAAVGTVIPPLSALPDVVIVAPTAQQVLVWDGSAWTAQDAPSTAAPSAFIYYPDDTTSGTLLYKTLSVVPTGGAEIQDAVVITAGSGETPIEDYLGQFLDRTVIPAGIWEFNSFASVDIPEGTTQIYANIFVRDIAGAETPLFTAISEQVTSPAPQQVSVLTTQSAFLVAPTDRIVAKYAAITTAVNPVTVTFYHNGTALYSHFHTPLGLGHNDLAGLQGGQAFEYYHLTASQSSAAQGQTAPPSASNKFITNDDARLQSYLLAQAGTALAYEALQTAWAGTSDASSQGTAFMAEDDKLRVLGWTGTATADVALQVAGAGTNAAAAGIQLANAAALTAQSGTAAGAAGIDLANSAALVAQAGTAAAGAGINLANTALTTAQAGTAAGAAGIDLANTALVTAYAGTTAAASKLDLAGGTLTGNLVAPNVQVGVGTVPYSQATSGTIYYDFAGPSYQLTTVDGTIFVSGTRMSAGREIAVLLQQTGTAKTLGYSSSFTWFGTIPPAQISNKNVPIAMTSLGNNLSDVIAGVSVAQ